MCIADGQTSTCDGTAIPLLKNLCSVSFFVGTLNAEGELEEVAAVDPSALFKV